MDLEYDAVHLEVEELFDEVIEKRDYTACSVNCFIFKLRSSCRGRTICIHVVIFSLHRTPVENFQQQLCDFFGGVRAGKGDRIHFHVLGLGLV